MSTRAPILDIVDESFGLQVIRVVWVGQRVGVRMDEESRGSTFVHNPKRFHFALNHRVRMHLFEHNTKKTLTRCRSEPSFECSFEPISNPAY